MPRLEEVLAPHMAMLIPAYGQGLEGELSKDLLARGIPEDGAWRADVDAARQEVRLSLLRDGALSLVVKLSQSTDGDFPTWADACRAQIIHAGIAISPADTRACSDTVAATDTIDTSDTDVEGAFMSTNMVDFPLNAPTRTQRPEERDSDQARFQAYAIEGASQLPTNLSAKSAQARIRQHVLDRSQGIE